MDIKVAQKVAEAVEALLKKYPELAKTTCERCRQSIYKEIKEELLKLSEPSRYRVGMSDETWQQYWKSKGVE